VNDQKSGSTAASYLPADRTLPTLKNAACECRGCELYVDATQTVFGQGPGKAKIMLVGEQPGDEEDRRGEPFVGPAGNVLNRALKDAGLDRRAVYLTNAVKHFRFVVQAKRRKHQAPSPSHITACRPWLEAEIDSIDPHVVVCLGATAARSLLGQGFRLTKERGKALKTRWAPHVVATFHPSAVLRGIDTKSRETLYESLVHDLKVAADLL